LIFKKTLTGEELTCFGVNSGFNALSESVKQHNETLLFLLFALQWFSVLYLEIKESKPDAKHYL